LTVYDEGGGFTRVPNALLRLPNLSRDAKILYVVLLSYAWQTNQCFPGYDRLQADLQCGRPQLAKYLRELRDYGLIQLQRRGRGQTTLYTLCEKFQTGTSPGRQEFQTETSRSAEPKLLQVSDRNRKNDSIENNSGGQNRPVTPEDAAIWETAKEALRGQMSARNWDLRIADLRLVGHTGDLWYLQAQTFANHGELQGRWGRLLTRALGEAVGYAIKIRFVPPSAITETG
jgi:hypothetical protein